MSNLFSDVLSYLVMRPTGSAMTGYILTASPGCVSYRPQSLQLMLLLGFHVNIMFASHLFLCCHLSTDSFFLPLCRYGSWIVMFLSRFPYVFLCWPLASCAAPAYISGLFQTQTLPCIPCFLAFLLHLCHVSYERCTVVMMTHH
jgi:hypothetical protein